VSIAADKTTAVNELATPIPERRMLNSLVFPPTKPNG
jgi:hypothetical protein